MSDINTAIIERLEKVVQSLQDNSVKMGQLLAVHKDLTRETDTIKKGCERDIRKVDDRLRMIEKKMWTIAGGLVVISFIISLPGQVIMRNLTNDQGNTTIERLVK